MAGHASVGFQGGGNFIKRLVGFGQNTGEVHHLAEAYDTIPSHGLCHVVGVDAASRIFKTRHGRNARRRSDHCLKRRAAYVLDHFLDALQPYDVCYFVGIPINAHGSVRHNGTGVLGGSHHGGLDVDMAVEESGGKI